MSAVSREMAAGLPPLVASYRPLDGIPDEMIGPDGSIRAPWLPLLAHLSTLSPAEIAARFGRGDQYLRDAGVYYRHYGKGDVASRDWPLSHVPVILAESEWQALAGGLVQRAELLEAVMADIYGENRLLESGDLPGTLLAANPHWLRPLVGVKPASGHFLHFIAMDLGRGEDGRWWVLGDRTEAPSGAGFALETRVATSRVFAEIYRQSNVHRLAGFFGAFRDMLDRMRAPGTGSVGLLTSGLFNETYYEQAYIARYLGLSLLEGEDLIVEGEELKVRTIDGPQPISVLWRRLESAWCDPLELDERSRLGTPGLLDAIRAGRVTMANALGAGALETQAFLAFLPRLCERLRGESLAIPNVATWWCGQEAEYHYVRENRHKLVISRANANRLPIELDPQGSTVPEAMTLESWLDEERHALVGQEAVRLSTTPAWKDGVLAPRPMTLRVFLARTPDGWQVMPGGFARVGQTLEPGSIAMRHGSNVADVWIVGERPVPEPSLLRKDGAAFMRKQPGTLPARAADNLFWLGRYVERTEGMLRLLRAYHGRLAESADTEAPLLQQVAGLLETYGMDLAQPLPAEVLSSIQSAVTSAGKIRDRFSLDGWSALVDLASSAEQIGKQVQPGDDAARAISVLIRKLTGFSGLVHENMYRAMGWRFLTIGQAIERAIGMADWLAAMIPADAPDGALDLMIEVGDSVMTHRRRYAMAVPESVCDLMVLDSLNPRSILFELERMQAHIDLLPGSRRENRLSPLGQALLKLRADVATMPAEAITPEWLLDLKWRIAGLSDALTDTYFA
ncbi:MAG: circularly permuted type 2 ATP-grasp protein [Beijerinckiaceae bacterium]|nr:circularly permuted type 2 ATP-grasp protein [Beijerinckiaceae bacterium]MCZ8300131.1 circularly permuted type 2 ATP-grasp protein [Beijerinckiaceae bacterium]